MRRFPVAGLGAAVLLASVAHLSIGLAADDSERLLSVDHFVRVRSTVPAIAGQEVPIYVRERVQAGTLSRAASLSGRVAVFIHGAGTPAEASFDTSHSDYSWMGYLARAGYDVFSVDMTGYGR